MTENFKKKIGEATATIHENNIFITGKMADGDYGFFKFPLNDILSVKKSYRCITVCFLSMGKSHKETIYLPEDEQCLDLSVWITERLLDKHLKSKTVEWYD